MKERTQDHELLPARPAAKPTRFVYSIGFQLSIAVTIIIVAVVLTLGIGMRERLRRQLYDQTVKIGTVTLNYFENNAAVPLLENDTLRLNSLLKDCNEVEGILYAFILDNNGVVAAHSDMDQIGRAQHFLAGREKEVSADGIVQIVRAMPSGKNALNLSRPVDFSDKVVGQVHVGVSLDFIEESVRNETWKIVKMTGFILAAGIFAAIIYGIGFSRPTRELLEATREIRRGNYGHKVSLNRKDEFGKLAGAFNDMSKELLAKDLMKQSFGKYVGNEILDMILRSPEKNWLKGEKREATVVFADIRNFTSYSESREPEKVVEELNQFFEIATEIITSHGGYVDKFIGDAVLGVFGVPVNYPDHMWRGVRACLEMIEIFRMKGKGGNKLLAAAALSANSGLVVSGNIGSQSKMEYTVIGDAVNLASRINSLAGPGELIVGSTIYEHLGHLLKANALVPAQIKGKSELVKTYRIKTLLDPKEQEGLEIPEKREKANNVYDFMEKCG